MFRGFAKKTNSKNPSLLWKWVGGSRSHLEFCCGKSSQNCSKPVLIFWSSVQRAVCTLLQNVVNECSVHVSDRIQKKFGWGWVGGVSSIQVYFGFLDFLLTLVLVACGHSLPANDLRKPDLSNVPNLYIQL